MLGFEKKTGGMEVGWQKTRSLRFQFSAERGGMVKWLRKSSVAASGLVPDGCLRLGLCKAAIEKKWGGVW